MPTRPWVGAALGGAAVLGAVAFAMKVRSSRDDELRPTVVVSSSDAAPPADWCASGFEPIAGGACFAAPPPAGTNQPLVVYLHGRYARDASAEEVDRQRRLGARAGPRGFAVLALRGRLGQCTASELADWYCWPSNEHNASDAPFFVASWAEALASARDRTRGGSRFLLGFSNGAYFAGLLATRAMLDVDAVVIAHGGPVEPVGALGRKPPLLLLSADDDVSQDEMIRFEQELSPLGWAHDSYARFGGHALTDEDIDAALAFFQRAGERLPLNPPLGLHRPVHHDHAAMPADASDEASVPSDAADPAEWQDAAQPSQPSQGAEDAEASSP